MTDPCVEAVVRAIAPHLRSTLSTTNPDCDDQWQGYDQAVYVAGLAIAAMHSSRPVEDGLTVTQCRDDCPYLTALKGEIEGLRGALEEAACQLDKCADMLEHRHIEPLATRAAARSARQALGGNRPEKS